MSDGNGTDGSEQCPVCETDLHSGMTGPMTLWCPGCEMEYWREGDGWWRCDESGEPENVQKLAADGGNVQSTPPYQGEPDEWSYGDTRHGANVPWTVRRGGATGPAEREKIGNNGVALRNSSFKFRCEDCDDVRRFCTSEFMTMYRCHECEDVRWFRFDWDLNRRGSNETTTTGR